MATSKLEYKLEDVSTRLAIAQESIETMTTIDGACHLLERVHVPSVGSTESSDTLAEAARKVHAFEMKLMEAERATRDTERTADAEEEQCPGTTIVRDSPRTCRELQELEPPILTLRRHLATAMVV